MTVKSLALLWLFKAENATNFNIKKPDALCYSRSNSFSLSQTYSSQLYIYFIMNYFNRDMIYYNTTFQVIPTQQHAETSDTKRMQIQFSDFLLVFRSKCVSEDPKKMKKNVG